MNLDDAIALALALTECKHEHTTQAHGDYEEDEHCVDCGARRIFNDAAGWVLPTNVRALAILDAKGMRK